MRMFSLCLLLLAFIVLLTGLQVYSARVGDASNLKWLLAIMAAFVLLKLLSE